MEKEILKRAILLPKHITTPLQFCSSICITMSELLLPFSISRVEDVEHLGLCGYLCLARFLGLSVTEVVQKVVAMRLNGFVSEVIHYVM
jgi:hypothetical protein